ncbi:MAG: NAD-dependent succinate-semialdehyde dehydrogenase [Spirochaetaceae bacterium]|nr:MAG: NAD-dependent succinate-semialdehyde dehydrogenase [Spirochaetaceae bacterium]
MENYKLFLNGRWVDMKRHFEVTDPGTGETFARVPLVGREETRTAIEAANEIFDGWRSLPGMARGDYLLAVAALLRERKEQIARVITRVNGKPLAQSRGEVDVSIDHLRWFAEEARRAYGRVIPHQAEGKRHLVLKHPVGVVAAIPPWNFPLVLAVRKAAPALAAGCPVILKPSRQTPLCTLELARCVEEAGLPAGIFQVLCGPAEEIVAEFMGNPRCRKVSFTGSTEIGKKLLEASAKTVTKLSLELGGHAPVLVFADADLDRAVEGAIITKFRNTGQSCIAANRIYVQREIYQEFLVRFVEKTRALKVGYGLEEDADIGALINRQALGTALAHIENALAGGARLLCGGKPAEVGGAGSGGIYLQPTVLADVPADAACMREETFAPVAPVCAFDHEEQAIEQANNTRYGLAAYAYTNDLNRAWRLAERLEAGTIAINDAVPSTSNAPFGGMKESGLGRELGSEGLEAFLETKHISFGSVG